MKDDIKLEFGKLKETFHKYYNCDRCGYVSLIKDLECPVCKIDGLSSIIDKDI